MRKTLAEVHRVLRSRLASLVGTWDDWLRALGVLSRFSEGGLHPVTYGSCGETHTTSFLPSCSGYQGAMLSSQPPLLSNHKQRWTAQSEQ